jgi:hypothetical protein
MKPCIQCGRLLPLERFYVHPQMADGHLNKCKECCIEYARRRRIDAPDAVRENDRRRSRSLRRRQWRSRFEPLQRQRHPEKYRAHTAVNNAIRDGRLVRQPCVVCGENRVEGHHPDYDNPLHVVWLCPDHHRMVHTSALSV